MPNPLWGEPLLSVTAPPTSEQDWLVPIWRQSRAERQVSFDGFTASFPPPTNRIFGQINSAVRFAPGDLLFNVIPDNICYHFSQVTRKFTYVFELDWGPGSFLWSVRPDRHGNVFASMSGMRTPPPITDASFGNWGGIIVVNPRKHAMRTLAERGTVVDPYSLQLLPDGQLLVCDFAGFGGSGRIYTVDALTGQLNVLVEGDFLRDPTSAYIDDGGTIWIANGDQTAQDGEVLCVERSGARRIVSPSQGEMTGALLGVFPAHDPKYLLATKNEWANRTKTCILLVEKSSGTSKPILTADEDNPKFFSTLGCVIDDKLWIAECVGRELLEVGLPGGEVLNRIDLRPIMGGHCGMRNSFDSISAIYAVPD